jgi:hypothetical protein
MKAYAEKKREPNARIFASAQTSQEFARDLQHSDEVHAGRIAGVRGASRVNGLRFQKDCYGCEQEGVNRPLPELPPTLSKT